MASNRQKKKKRQRRTFHNRKKKAAEMKAEEARVLLGAAFGIVIAATILAAVAGVNGFFDCVLTGISAGLGFATAASVAPLVARPSASSARVELATLPILTVGALAYSLADTAERAGWAWAAGIAAGTLLLGALSVYLVRTDSK